MTVPQSGAANKSCLDLTDPLHANKTRPEVYTNSRFSHASPHDLQQITPEHWTVEASVKIKQLHKTRQTVVCRDGVTGKSARFVLLVNPDDGFAVNFIDVQERYIAVNTESSLVKENQWYHLAAVSDGRELRLYVDRGDGRGYELAGSTKLPGSGTAMGKCGDDCSWAVGRSRLQKGTVGDALLGWIDEVRICDEALDPRRVPLRPDEGGRPAGGGVITQQLRVLLLARRLSIVVIFLAALAAVSPAHAATDTWVGNTSVNWADTNWNGADNPPLSGDALVFDVAGGFGTTLNDNLTTSGSNISGITFTAAAPAYTISGDGFTLAGSLTNSGSNLQTVNDPFSLTAVQTFTTVAGGGNITLGGNISGVSGGITAAGTGILTLSGSNTLGRAYVNGGTLSISGRELHRWKQQLVPFQFGAGNASGGLGVVNVLPGANIAATNSSGWNLDLGEVVGGYGAMNISGGSISTWEFEVGNNGYGLYNQSGGTVSVSNWFLLGRNGNRTSPGSTPTFGVANFSGGQFIATTAGMNMEFGFYTGGTNYSYGGDLDVSSTASVNLGSNSLYVGVNTSGGRGW